MTHHHNPEHLGSRRGLDRKLDHIMERLKHMATEEQVAKLSADVEALLAALAHQAATAVPPAPPAPVADPAVDALDAKVLAATAALTPAPAG